MTKAKMQKRIDILEDAVKQYYDANYDAKTAIKDRNGFTAPLMYYCGSEISGNEEGPQITTFDALCEVVDALPLLDCGILK